jgi:hypothetical protein
MEGFLKKAKKGLKVGDLCQNREYKFLNILEKAVIL